MIPLGYFLIIGIILFGLGFAGIIINRNNLITLFMCIELMLLAVNTNFVAFAQYFQMGVGEIFVFFILTVAAAESAIGLAILVLCYRHHSSIGMDNMKVLKG
ncbi:NADH-quinone oxidoreductase subunit NuoK [Coxiella endosymbiont of Amblyomma nuttalli]|uniref:NADH-quinone oxidoreductase subunit NuoK n=1 Tax=Coxiella endosymbiont of Amblyomma nuttalli TaxID=2749996 RepID=UPI001BAD8C45|nr:NADH-quinone oxidoreductase subunit NuoK [Coxiella endosymbiont of Amblyomma nuttalli]QTS83677.1 NADH-quinone oxidoreductase subunit K [Coxiella endosymbiont of Amblyomma nuttalli]